MSLPPVLGADACKQGWVGITLAEGFAGARVAAHLADLVAAAEADTGPLAVVAVDMPIGLPDSEVRQADVLAGRRIGSLRSSVFRTPVRAALEEESYLEAARVHRAAAGYGLARQSYALRTKLLEVDTWVRQGTHRVVEVHPEVSFAEMAGAPLVASKKTWAGMVRRRELLAGAGIVVPDEVGAAGMAGVDDVLDAAAAAWTARRVERGEALSLPAEPETFSDGLPSAIWY